MPCAFCLEHQALRLMPCAFCLEPSALHLKPSALLHFPHRECNPEIQNHFIGPESLLDGSFVDF